MLTNDFQFVTDIYRPYQKNNRPTHKNGQQSINYFPVNQYRAIQPAKTIYSNQYSPQQPNQYKPSEYNQYKTDNVYNCRLFSRLTSYNPLSILLEYLTQQFKESRTVEQLKRELMHTFPYRKEHPIDFINRIAKIRSLILSRIKFYDEIVDKKFND